MKKFEYKATLIIKDELINNLNRHGDDGWQLVQIIDNGRKFAGYAAFDAVFMREVIIHFTNPNNLIEKEGGSTTKGS